jgi:SAM-dependent methyltransferase
MSRKYMNDRWCVRCGKEDATPYLKKHYEKLFETCNPSLANVLDIGCGNGRNSEFMKSLGVKNIVSLDMAGDYGSKCVLDGSPLPLFKNTVDIILANYCLMFLKNKERQKVLKDIKKAAKKHSFIMVELYPAKDSYCKNPKEMEKMQKEIFDQLSWKKILYSKGKFIAQCLT